MDTVTSLHVESTSGAFIIIISSIIIFTSASLVSSLLFFLRLPFFSSPDYCTEVLM